MVYEVVFKTLHFLTFPCEGQTLQITTRPKRTKRMFSWFRRYVQKIGIFGVEVEFRPPNDTSTTVPPPAVDIGFVQPVLPSDQLIAILQNNVGPLI